MKQLVYKIEKFMKKIWEFLVKVTGTFFGKTFEFLAKNSGVAVIITDKLKQAVESHHADTAVDIIPGDFDNRLLKVLRKTVPVVAFKLALTHKIVTENDTNSDVIAAVIKYLQENNPQASTSFYVMFAAELNLALADGKINIAEAIFLTQMAYRGLLKK
jgi:hypothetical protein